MIIKLNWCLIVTFFAALIFFAIIRFNLCRTSYTLFICVWILWINPCIKISAINDHILFNSIKSNCSLDYDLFKFTIYAWSYTSPFLYCKGVNFNCNPEMTEMYKNKNIKYYLWVLIKLKKISNWNGGKQI